MSEKMRAQLDALRNTPLHGFSGLTVGWLQVMDLELRQRGGDAHTYLEQIQTAIQQRLTTGQWSDQDQVPDIATVYAFSDPRNGLYRWVDSTDEQAEGPLDASKLLTRISDRAVHSWVSELADCGEGLAPQVVVLDRVPLISLASRRQHWYNVLRSQGVPLLNDDKSV